MIGEPGAGLSDAFDKFGEDNVTRGMAGEQLTSDEFRDSSSVFPVMQLVNGLRFPGSETADVDHALVYGNKAAYLDSKFWMGDNFSWNDSNSIVSGRGRDLRVHEINSTAAVDTLAERLKFDNKEARGWVIVHSPENKEITVVQGAEGLTSLVSGRDWLHVVTSWLQEGQEVPTSDEQLGDHCETLKIVLDGKQ